MNIRIDRAIAVYAMTAAVAVGVGGRVFHWPTGLTVAGVIILLLVSVGAVWAMPTSAGTPSTRWWERR